MATKLNVRRKKKEALVEELTSNLRQASAVFLTEYRGLSTKDLKALRNSLGNNAKYKVYKNTLIKRSLSPDQLQTLEKLLEGPTAIAFSFSDPVLVAKALNEFSKSNPLLVIKGGLLGSEALDSKGTEALAALPSKEVLIARFAQELAQPLARFARDMSSLFSNFVYGLKNLEAKKQEEANK